MPIVTEPENLPAGYSPFRIGSVHYLNAAPLTFGIENEIVFTTPAHLAEMLRRDELEGATFSVSNLGPNGPDRFTAMINPPESAILAVGRERDTAVVRGGGLQIRPMVQLTLTVDHRIADGRLASEVLRAIVEALEGATWNLL